jgi:hypothetical protein
VQIEFTLCSDIVVGPDIQEEPDDIVTCRQGRRRWQINRVDPGSDRFREKNVARELGDRHRLVVPRSQKFQTPFNRDGGVAGVLDSKHGAIGGNIDRQNLETALYGANVDVDSRRHRREEPNAYALGCRGERFRHFVDCQGAPIAAGFRVGGHGNRQAYLEGVPAPDRGLARAGRDPLATRAAE